MKNIAQHRKIELVLYVLFVLFSVKWLVMISYTYSNEEDLYIHPQDPFRGKTHAHTHVSHSWER